METHILVRYDWTEKKVLNISSDICDETFRFISADKSDQFIPKVSNDICIETLTFVISERTEKKVLNISSDLSVVTNLINFYQKSTMVFALQNSSLSDLKELKQKY